MTDVTSTYHVPVLLHESIDGLAIKKDGIYVDVTFGGGGHSKEILSRLGQNGRLFAFDQDQDAEKNIGEDARLTFIASNFRFLKNWMRYYNVDHIDGLLADLGVSSHHLDSEARGFTFRQDAPLDMRMNQRATKTAADVVNTYSEERLADVFYFYGEMRQARQLAKRIVCARTTLINTTGQLVEIARPLIHAEQERRELAKLFQALRIEVNGELNALREMLNAAIDLLGNGGRLAVITYHSLEDRIVKNYIKSGNAEGKTEKDFYGKTTAPLSAYGKLITPSKEEIENNPRARSAKLRIAEKR